jgi:hypothetical protein
MRRKPEVVTQIKTWAANDPKANLIIRWQNPLKTVIS